jgi:integrase
VEIIVRYLRSRTYKGKTYHYWRPNEVYIVGGEKVKCPYPAEELPEDPIQAATRAEQLNQMLDEWRSGLVVSSQPVKDSFDWLIVDYKKSRNFKELGERTQKEYGYILEAVRETLRDRKIAPAPAAEYTRIHARSLINLFEKTPRKQQLVAAICRIVFNHGIETGVVQENPFKEMRIKRNKPREQIWLDLDSPNNLFHRVIALKQAAMAKGLPSMALAIDIALFSMQRQGDILILSWSKYDGQGIRLRQGKTRTWVYVPVTRIPTFKIILDSATKTSPIMLISERTGKPYDKDHFGDVFREIREDAGQPKEMQYRDFRRTGMVLWGMSGAQPQEIAAVSGHSIDKTSHILETYIPRNMIMAENGADQLQARYGEQLKKIQMIG